MKKYWEHKGLKNLITNKLKKYDNYYTRPFSFYGTKFDYYTRSGRKRKSPTIRRYRSINKRSYKLRSKWF